MVTFPITIKEGDCELMHKFTIILFVVGCKQTNYFGPISAGNTGYHKN